MKFWRLTTTVIALFLSTSTNAALIERLGGLAYYDTEADLTWLADANYAQTSGYSADGRMYWEDANAWAANLNIESVTGWRLADTDASCGFSSYCTGSEMSNLFFNVLGGNVLDTQPKSVTTTFNANYDLFSNVQLYYWTATEGANTDYAWVFSFDQGFQGTVNKYSVGVNANHAWAVYSGDVSAVPVPPAVWLFGSGLIGLICFTRRKKA